MQVTGVGYSPLPLDLAKKGSLNQQPGGFMEMLSSALREVSQLQGRADELSAGVALGKGVELHDAVLAAEEANLAFQYTLQIRNKLIEAYQEIMRMQV